MSDKAISIWRLGKQYRIGSYQPKYRTLRDTVMAVGRRPLGRLAQVAAGAPPEQTIWALSDVSLEVEPGESVGIIGRNGAGKSTLLRILSHITEPTTGRVEIRGRVGSLLEVGTGFHPELTGRENIYLNGAILGMKRPEIARKFDEIVEFAEVEKFLDTPVKHYSSGMYVRLAFAVAAHLEPEILVIDEVLAVGDMAFQRKCLGKMDDVTNEGRTVIFVSHNLPAILKLCRRCVWLQSGKLAMDGEPNVVVEQYSSNGMSAQGECHWDDLKTAPGNEELSLKAVRIVNHAGKVSSIVDIARGFAIQLDYQILRPVTNVALVVWLYNVDGTLALISGDLDAHGGVFTRESGDYRSQVMLPGNFLNAGSYHVHVYAHVPHIRTLFTQENALMFEVFQSDYIGGEHVRRQGVVRPVFEWAIERIEAANR